MFGAGKSAATVPRSPSRYERGRGDALRHRRRTSEEVRDIGPSPEVKNAKLREECDADLEAYYRIVYPNLFIWPFSKNQKRNIQRTQDVIEHGGFSLDVEPRGTGKTQRAVRAALWAIKTGRRRYACVFSATATLAQTQIIEALILIVSSDGIIRDLYGPELHGFAQLEGHNRRAKAQLCMGQRTGINLGSTRIIFPEIAGSKASGSVVSGWGITAAFLGQTHTLRTGEVIRPDFLLLDDPQTRESAKSASQTADRSKAIHSSMLGLAGPGTRIACCAQCTVIEPNDLTEQLLQDDRWHGIRGQAIINWPKNMAAWDAYFIERKKLEKAKQLEKINEYFKAHEAELTEGFELAWPERIAAEDVSPFQTIMHVRELHGPSAFEAEHQNAPVDITAAADAPTFDGLHTKLVKTRARGIAPRLTTWLTAGIDVQKRYLPYLVLGTRPGFTCSIAEYGAWPEQPRSYFTRANAYPTLESASESSQQTGALTWGLKKLTEYLLGRAWPIEGGGEMRISRVLIDANDGNMMDTIYAFCAQSEFGGLLTPAHGQGQSAKRRPIADWTIRDGEQLGIDWLRKPGDGKRRFLQHVLFDSNAWKTFMAARARAIAGDPGWLDIYGENPEVHRMLFNHLAGEKAKRVVVDGRSFWQWVEVLNEENDFLDTLVMAGVAASMEGAMLADVAPPPKPPEREWAVIPEHLLRTRA